MAPQNGIRLYHASVESREFNFFLDEFRAPTSEFNHAVHAWRPYDMLSIGRFKYT